MRSHMDTNSKSESQVDIEQLKAQFESDSYKYEHIFPYRVYRAWGKEHQFDFCIISHKSSPDKKVIRLQKRFFGVTKAMAQRGETQPRWAIYDSFNLNPALDFPSFYAIIGKFKSGQLSELRGVIQSIDFDGPTSRIVGLTKKLKNYSSKHAKSRRDVDEHAKTQEEINTLLEKVNLLNEQNRRLRIQSYKANVSRYRKALKDARASLVTEASNEAFFQDLFTRNKWIFGPWYEDVLPKKKADTDNQPDFVLKRFDGFVDVVEIEAPSKYLFTIPDKSNKSQPRAELTQALAQVIDYIDSYNENYKDQFFKSYASDAQNPLNPYKPRGLLIIGRDKKVERMKLRQFNSFLNNVVIITYDEFLQNSESIMELAVTQKV